MKRAPWYLAVGAIAGFAGVLGLTGRAAAPAASASKGQGSGTQGGQQGTGSGGATPASTGQPAQATAPGGVHTASGALEQYGYGELSVKVTANGNKITNVTVPTLRTAEQYSQQLASQVIPMLKSQVLAAGSARINGVSGATYTSQAYAMSLQAALDKLHIR
jgi:uncharacterized protein with FMN-binding domain